MCTIPHIKRLIFATKPRLLALPQTGRFRDSRVPGLVPTPVELTIEGGHLVGAAGPEGERLMELLSAHGEDGTNVAELGIGSNERAELTGNVLEDEKILGSCHVAFGASASMGGTVQVPVHLDCVVMRPDVSVDGEPLVRAGELLVGG